MIQGVQALPFRQTWTGRRFLLDSIKYIVAACTITICAFTFISPHGSQRVYYDPAIAASGLQTAQTEIPAFDSSLLDSRRYVKGPAAGRFRGIHAAFTFVCLLVWLTILQKPSETTSSTSQHGTLRE